MQNEMGFLKSEDIILTIEFPETDARPVMKTPDKLLKIKIALSGIKPAIWRRVLLPESLSLREFHQAVRLAMGWNRNRSCKFIKDDQVFCPVESKKNIHHRNLTAGDLLHRKGDSIIYEYNSGEGWTHTVTLEETLDFDGKTHSPKCIGGARACPPEKCEGTGGYIYMIEAINNPDHPEHDDMLNHFGGYDPDLFDKDDVNERLAGHA